MFLNALLEASAKTTNIVKWVSVGAIVVLFGVIAVICIKGKKRYDAKHIAFAGISLSLSFVLSLIKVSPLLTAAPLPSQVSFPYSSTLTFTDSPTVCLRGSSSGYLTSSPAPISSLP